MPVNNQPQMPSRNATAIGHAPFLMPQSRTKERASVFAAFVLGVIFNASLVSVVGSKLDFFQSSVGNAIAASALLVLIIIGWSRPKRFKLTSLPGDLKRSVLFMCATGIIVGGLAIAFSPYRNTVFLKLGGVLVSIFAMASASRNFNAKEVKLALIIFAFVELLGCIVLFRMGTEVNENTIAVRATVACMCLFTLLGPIYLKWAAFAGCLSFSLALGCRTSAMALIGATTFLYVERNSRRQRGLVVFLSIAGFISVIVLLPFILAAISQVAMASLGSDNPIAKFFLHDKTSAKISYDYLDRFDVWTFAWSYIKEKPFIGYGLGTEQSIMLVRCHNAYLSLLFEGGHFLAVFVVVVLWLYGG